MEKTEKSLFNLVVGEEKLHPSFQKIRSNDGSIPARWMFDQIYSTFQDPDKNFLEQFQTTGFDARCFELYLYAYFTRSGFEVDHSHSRPDFIVTRNGQRVAVEATTVNPSKSGAVKKFGNSISKLSHEEVQSYQRNELCIRFGSSLFSKLQNKYWELPHCEGLPFVIAVEAFHDDGSLGFSSNSLARYLYGLEHEGRWKDSGELAIEVNGISDHHLGEKSIPSDFFSQPNTEYVSAILFTNAGTSAKFSRMGFQHGIGNDIITMRRAGFFFNPLTDAMDPTFLSYDLDAPPFVESWGQGMVLLHNPKALNPISMDFFEEEVQTYIQDGVMKTDVAEHHPMSSSTYILHLGESKKLMEGLPTKFPCCAVNAITKKEFQFVTGINNDENPLHQEHGWFVDNTYSFVGVLIFDKIDSDWGYVIMARDEYARFREIESDVSMPHRQKARENLQLKIVELMDSPKRIFNL